jgi:hypothetical protein
MAVVRAVELNAKGRIMPQRLVDPFAETLAAAGVRDLAMNGKRRGLACETR